MSGLETDSNKELPALVLKREMKYRARYVKRLPATRVTLAFFGCFKKTLDRGLRFLVATVIGMRLIINNPVSFDFRIKNRARRSARTKEFVFTRKISEPEDYFNDLRIN